MCSGYCECGDDDDSPQPGFDRWVSFRGQGTYYDPLLNIDGERSQHQGYTAEILTDYAIDWLEAPREEPFFMYLSHKSVHSMFEPDTDDVGRYDQAELTYPITISETEENIAAQPEWVREQRNSWHGVDYMYHGAMDFDTFYRRYTETLHSLDKSIGPTILDLAGVPVPDDLFRSREHQALIGEMRERLFTRLEEGGGMSVPLRVPQGFRGGNRGP